MAHNPFPDLANISTPDCCTDLYQIWHHLARLHMPDNAGLIMMYGRLKLGLETGAERSAVFSLFMVWPRITSHDQFVAQPQIKNAPRLASV